MTDILLPCDGGHTCIVYHVMPSTPARGLVVVVHEAYGLTPHVRGVCDRLAAAGFRAAAPDLLSRKLQGRVLPYTPEGASEGNDVVGDLTLDRLVGDIGAVLDGLDRTAPRAVLGFGIGGTLAWLAAAAIPLHAALAYGPQGIECHLDAVPHCPVLLHVGLADPGLPLSSVEAISAAFPHTEIERHNAGEAFDRNHVSAAVAAGSAWRQSLDFLNRRLQSRDR